MKIAIVGSRDFSRPDLVREAVRKIAARDPTTIIVSGGARGVDTWAEEEARRLGLIVEVYLADWKGLGRGAGMVRNKQIVQTADRILAFWDKTSRGTAHTIKLAKEAKKPCFVVEEPVR